MAKKKANNGNRTRITLKANSELDRLVYETMGHGFKLCRTTDPIDFEIESAAWKLVIDGLGSCDPLALAFTVLLNSILTHRRLVFVLFKEDFNQLLKYDVGLRSQCSRRKREKAKAVRYIEFRAFMRQSGYFKEVARLKTKNNQEAIAFEVQHPAIAEFLLAKGINAAKQLFEIEEFYKNSRDNEAKIKDQEMRNNKRKAKLASSTPLDNRKAVLSGKIEAPVPSNLKNMPALQS